MPPHSQRSDIFTNMYVVVTPYLLPCVLWKTCMKEMPMLKATCFVTLFAPQIYLHSPIYFTYFIVNIILHVCDHDFSFVTVFKVVTISTYELESITLLIIKWLSDGLVLYIDNRLLCSHIWVQMPKH